MGRRPHETTGEHNGGRARGGRAAAQVDLAGADRKSRGQPAADAAGPPLLLEAPVLAAARTGDPDRYLAALLAPARARPALLVVAAYLAELRRAVGRVREPQMGEIRLQWWREALQLDARLRSGNPIADALRALASAKGLPHALLEDAIDARWRDLKGAPLADEAELGAYLWKGEGAAFLLAAHALGAQATPNLHAAAAAAGSACGLIGLLQGTAAARGAGRVLLPDSFLQAVGLGPEALLGGEGGEPLARLITELLADIRRHRAAARQYVAQLPAELRPAFLPLAVVGSYIRAIERAGAGILNRPAAIAPLTRIARLTAARWLGV